MDVQLDGRTVLISGAASGIGRACAYAFAREGARVALLDIDAGGRSLADELRIDASAEAAFFRADVSVERDVVSGVQSAVARFGAVDVVVACALRAGQRHQPGVRLRVPGAFHIPRVIPALLQHDHIRYRTNRVDGR